MEDHIRFDEQYVLNSVDSIDAVQRLRQQIGNDKTTRVNLTLSAYALDILLTLVERGLKAQEP